MRRALVVLLAFWAGAATAQDASTPCGPPPPADREPALARRGRQATATWETRVGDPGRGPMTPADAFALHEVGEIRISPDASTVVFSVTDTNLRANRTSTRVMRVAATGG